MTDCRLFVDKYSPNTFADIKFNHIAAKRLQACSRSNNIPHLIISGGNGSGRKTFANLYLKSKYHVDDLHVRCQTMEIKSANKSIELQLLYSDYHYQIDPSIHGVYDRIIVQGFIKDILQTKPCNVPYHSIIINNADHLTFEAQQSLRRTLEKNINNCRFIFIISQELTLIDSLVSRCVQIRLAAPTDCQILEVLEHICASERIIYEKKQLHQVATYSQRNLSKALNLLQYLYLKFPRMLVTVSAINFDDINMNDKYIHDLALKLISVKNPIDLLNLRTTLYDLLVQCVEPIKIMKSLFHTIFDYLGKSTMNDRDDKKHQLVQILSKYENTLRQGSKPIYHIEAFCLDTVLLLNGSR